MSQRHEFDQLRHYRIVVEGHLDEKWSDWLGSFSFLYGEGITILEGTLPDQSGLYGMLNKIRDLNLKLISVGQVENDG